MADADFQIDVNVTGAEAAAGKLNTVADAEVLLAQRAAAQNDLAEAATRVSGKQTEALKDVAQAADTVAGSSANTAKSAAGMAWEFARAEEAGRGLSEILNGNLIYGIRYLATGMRGLFELINANPFVALAAVALAATALIAKYFETTKAEAEAATKEIAENTEQMGKRMEEALKHPGMAEYAIQIAEGWERVDAAQQKVLANNDKITASEDKLAEAIAKRALAQLEADEQSAISQAQKDGKSPNDIAKIRQAFADQRTAQSGQNETEGAAREVADAQQKLTDATKKAVEASRAHTDAAEQQAEHQAAAQATMDVISANFQARQAELQKKIDDEKALLDAETPAGVTPVYENDPIISGAQQEMAERQKEYQANAARAANTHAPINQADADKLQKSADALATATAELKEAINNLNAAQVNADTTGIKAGGAAAAQGGSDAEFNRTQAGVDLAGRVQAGVTAAAQSRTGNWGGVSALLGKVFDAGASERDDPTPQNLKDLGTALEALDKARQLQTGRLQRGLEDLISRVQNLEGQTANNRNRGSGFN